MKKTLALVLALLMVVSLFAGCVQGTDDPTTTGSNNSTNPTGGKEEIVITEFDDQDYIWKTSDSSLATSWNPHTYRDTVASVPLDYTTSGLYTFIFNDELNPVEGKDPYAGYVIIPEMAAEMPIDVTTDIKASHPQFNIPEDAESGYAYIIKLNEDACFDDGTPINAETYVESMKRLLNPELLNYRAPNWYGTSTLSIAGAEYYNNQGGTQYTTECGLQVADLTLNADGTYSTADGKPVYIAVDKALEWLGGDTLKFYVEYYGDYAFGVTYWEQLVAATNKDGFAPLTSESLTWITDVITAVPAVWGETEADLHNYLAYGDPYPTTWKWEDVGIFATGEYELTIVLDKSLADFYLLYNLSGLSSTLVKIDLYDSLLTSSESATGELVWSSTYNTSVETTVSFGPYKMSEYQTDKYMHFVRNENWWGYTDGKHIYKDPVDGNYYNMYQTTEVDIQVVAESATRKMMFMKGQLMGYGLQAEDYATLRQSEYCYATPGTTIFFLILNGNMEAIKNRENADDFDKAAQDLEMLTNTKFHMAMGLAYDKDNFAATISPARSGALGIIGSGYIYDPETGAQYRDTDQAKQVLCDFYGIDTSKYASLDDAVDAITGYDPTQAKVLFGEAFQEGLDAGYITDADGDGICDQKISIEYVMSGEVNDFMTKTINYMNEKIAEVATGTPFEGKIEFFLGPNVGGEWDTMLKEGMSDTCLAGWNGSTMDPFSLTDLYTNPEYQYDAAWYDATKVELTINVPVNGTNTDVTLTLKQWSDALNGTAVEANGTTYNFGAGQADVEVRLNILAAIEGKVLESYNYLPMLQDGSMALLTQQVYYVIEDYNPVMGRGGLAYAKYNYSESEWEAYVAEQGGELKY